MESLTWAEYHRLGQAFQRRRNADWERTRWQTCWLINVQLQPEDRLTAEDLLRLPTDAPAEVEAVGPPETPEEMMARIRLLDPDKFQ